MNGNGYIYILQDPRKDLTNEIDSVFYVGLTTNKKPEQRLNCHIFNAKTYREQNKYKKNKINKILSEGLRPIFKIIEAIHLIEEKNKLELKQREIYWIKYYKDLGCNLGNMSLGGDFNPMLDYPPEKIQAIKEKTKKTKKENFQLRLQKEAEQLGITVEQLKENKLIAQKKYCSEFQKNRREHYTKLCRKYRIRDRESLGEEAYKKKEKEDKRNYLSSLTEEQKEARRQRENEYRKNKRKNETEEQRKRRLELAAERRKEKPRRKRTPEEKILRANKNKEKRLNLTIEQKEEIKVKRQNKLKQETPEQREKRLKGYQNYWLKNKNS